MMYDTVHRGGSGYQGESGHGAKRFFLAREAVLAIVPIPPENRDAPLLTGENMATRLIALLSNEDKFDGTTCSYACR